MHWILNLDLGTKKIVLTENCVLIPRKIVHKAVSIKADVVKSQMPLLLCLESTKCVGATHVFLEIKINILVKTISLHFTFSGHFAILPNDDFEGSTTVEDSKFIKVFLTKDKSM